jgi:ribosome-binding protein aMBF1 (putative translation factor)
MNAKRRHVKTARSAEEQARIHALRDEFQRTRPTPEELDASGEYSEPITMGEYFDLQAAVAALKEARAQAGLSLADVAARSGIDRTYISRIENGQQANLTFETLNRLANALGKRFRMTLEDAAGRPKSREKVGA